MQMVPLFSVFKKLGEVLPYRRLGTLPTPVSHMINLSKKLGGPDVFIKRDDQSGTLYGGNKIRKLEFILADALKQGCNRIITSGAAGSNHALATALYGTQCGLQPTLMLFEQPPSPAIGPTLLADFATGAELFHDNTFTSHLKHIQEITDSYTIQDGRKPYLIPAGGSSVLGAVGFVNAAFELRQQINEGLLPQPDTIFTALGTMGTAVGLLLGLKAAKLTTRLVAVQVVPDVVANPNRFASFYQQLNTWLNQQDPAFPILPLQSGDVTITTDFLGEGYGFHTPEALDAITQFKENEAISLDPVYTGKTAAAMIQYCRTERSGNVLFWNTKSSVFPEIMSVDYHHLPEPFHQYFNNQQ